MKKISICIFTIIFSSILKPICLSQPGIGAPVKYIESCEFDLNNDSEADIAFLIESVRGRELIVLISKENSYKAYLLSRGKSDMYLSCHFGTELKETLAGRGKKKGKVYKTNGTYIQLNRPESSSVAYFWQNGAFREVWTSD